MDKETMAVIETMIQDAIKIERNRLAEILRDRAVKATHIPLPSTLNKIANELEERD